MKEEFFEYIENQRKTENERELFLRDRTLYEFYRNRRNNLFGIIFSIAGLIIILTKDLLYNFSDKRYVFIIIGFGVVAFSFGVGTLLFRYLQNGVFSRLTNNNVNQQNFRSELQDLRVEILKLRRKGGEPNDSENISRTINNAIDSTLTEEFIKSKIDGFYSEKAISESKHKSLLEDFENLGIRINGELTRLRKSANLNLVIGTLTTILALTALAYEVFNSEFEITDKVKILTHYLPRLSLIIFIEIFAFFFLKLYKATLSDIKYFNNEKTNVDFKLISLKTALNIGDSETIKIILQELVKTERNFKLSQNESTVELEKIKNETTNNQILSQLIEKIKFQK